MFSLLSKIHSLLFCSFKRICTTSLVLIFGISFVSLIVVGYVGSSELLAPPRKSLQTYHKAYLDSPESYGINIEKYTSRTDTPCLIVTARTNSPSVKAIKLQQLLAKDGLSIQSAPIANIILLHGRKGRKEDMLPVAERLCQLGFRCICIDLPGHGDHQSDECTYGILEAGLVFDTYSEIKESYNIAESETEYLFGFSMGGAVAIRAAAEHNEWDGLITVSTFTSLREVIHQQVRHRSSLLSKPIYHSISTFAAIRSELEVDKVNSEHLIQQVDIPSLLIHGDKDWLIPHQHCDRLHSSCGSQHKHLIKVKGASHPNALGFAGNNVYHKIAQFLLSQKQCE